MSNSIAPRARSGASERADSAIAPTGGTWTALDLPMTLPRHALQGEDRCLRLNRYLLEPNSLSAQRDRSALSAIALVSPVSSAEGMSSRSAISPRARSSRSNRVGVAVHG